MGTICDPYEPVGAKKYLRFAELMSNCVNLKPVESVKLNDRTNPILEVYLPNNTTSQTLPTLIFFHGGAWIKGGLHLLRFMIPSVLCQDCIFVTATYRLAPEYRWPTQYEDATTVYEITKKIIPKYNGDINKIVLSGHSAGGHLAALVALNLPPSSVAGCMPISAPLNLELTPNSPEYKASRAYKFMLRSDLDAKEASPINYISESSPTFHLTWGSNDLPHIIRTNIEAHELLSQLSQRHTKEIYFEDDHFETNMRLLNPYASWFAAFHRIVNSN